MYLYQKILSVLRRWFRSKPTYTLDIQTDNFLRSVAESEQRTSQEVAERLIHQGLRRSQEQRDLQASWAGLTPREQEITALVCMHYTNRQIADRLNISPETVKTHVGHILVKFNVRSRYALRILLACWDFSEWEED
jgi:RNA polymerase sigma factor (sigma-70 family)